MVLFGVVVWEACMGMKRNNVQAAFIPIQIRASNVS